MDDILLKNTGPAMLRTTLATITLVAAACAQPKVAGASATEPRIPRTLDYNEHRGVVLARIDGRSIRLEDLATHLEVHHAPGIKERWGSESGAREINSPALAQLMYQYVDVLCLRAEAKARGVKLATLPAVVDKLLQRGFDDYVKRFERIKKAKLTEHARKIYLIRYRREKGLELEVQGLLRLLVPPLYKTSELRKFLFKHGDWFGQVKFAHILLKTRDDVTGRLKSLAERAHLRKKATEIQAEIDKDPSAFADLARAHSDDKVTSKRGGEVLAWTNRSNPRLPASVLRVLWQLPNKGVAGIVDSFYGYHLVKRIKFVQHKFVIPHGKSWQKISVLKMLDDHEQFLIGTRSRHERVLRL